MANENCLVNIPPGHQFAMNAYGQTGNTYTRRLALISCGLMGDTATVRDDGITDTLWEQTGDEVISALRVGGQVSLNPRAEDLQDICWAIFGGSAFSTNVKLPGKICEYFDFGHADPYLDKIFNYIKCVTAQAQFSSSEGQLLRLDWDIQAQSRTIGSTLGGGAWPSLNLSVQQPFVFRQGTLVVNSVTTKFKRFNFTVDNGIQADDFFNSLTRGEMPSTAQTFTLTHDSPWDTASAASAVGTIKEVAATLEFLSGTKRVYFEFPRLFGIDKEPAVSGRQRIINGYSWRAKYVPGNSILAPVRITVVGS